MRRIVAVAIALLVLVGCSTGSAGPTQRYYDPNGFFSTRLPAANDVLVMPPQAVQGSPRLLSGVLALPPQPSPSPSGGAFGGGFVQGSTTAQDNAIYGVFVVKADRFSSISDLARGLLSGTLGPTVVTQRRITASGLEGLLAVVDHHDDSGGGGDYTDASGFFLDGHVGYWIRELFASGEWDLRRDGFLRILRSFQPGVPVGLPAIPITRQGLEVRSGIGWPLG